MYYHIRAYLQSQGESHVSDVLSNQLEMDIYIMNFIQHSHRIYLKYSLSFLKGFHAEI